MHKIHKVYDIDTLIDRFCNEYKSITGNSAIGKHKTIVKAPEIRYLNRKVFVNNFNDVCKSINRDLQDVSTYFSKELVVQTSISNTGALIIYGNYKSNKILSIFGKYVSNFVQCPGCKTQDTKIEKIERVQYIICNKCRAKSIIS